mmetsp:Transcript_20126/g.77173  ORF Transcript_20126/g.77173 Transcript_20126/m.77173 type:complete len:340 (+) Transcript_20126:1655-2674(+)
MSEPALRTAAAASAAANAPPSQPAESPRPRATPTAPPHTAASTSSKESPDASSRPEGSPPCTSHTTASAKPGGRTTEYPASSGAAGRATVGMPSASNPTATREAPALARKDTRVSSASRIQVEGSHASCESGALHTSASTGSAEAGPAIAMSSTSSPASPAKGSHAPAPTSPPSRLARAGSSKTASSLLSASASSSPIAAPAEPSDTSCCHSDGGKIKVLAPCGSLAPRPPSDSEERRKISRTARSQPRAEYHARLAGATGASLASSIARACARLWSAADAESWTRPSCSRALPTAAVSSLLSSQLSSAAVAPAMAQDLPREFCSQGPTHTRHPCPRTQ